MWFMESWTCHAQNSHLSSLSINNGFPWWYTNLSGVLWSTFEHACSQEQVAPCKMQSHHRCGFGGVTGQSQGLNDSRPLQNVWVVRDVDVFEWRFIHELREIPQLNRAVEGGCRENRVVSAKGQTWDGHRVARKIGEQVAMSQIPDENLLVRPSWC